MLIRVIMIATLSIALLSLTISSECAGTQTQPRTINLVGRVTSGNGVLAGASVKATNDRTNFSQTTRTDDKGFYRFVGLPFGHYLIEVEASGFQKMNGTIELAENQTFGLNFEFEVGGGAVLTGTAEGKVTDEANRGIAGARIKIVEEGTTLTQEVTTDADGSYVISSLSPGRYQIAVEAANYKLEKKGITVKSKKQETKNFHLGSK